jgi:dehydrogenase/reductase SDR family protein 7B
MNQEIIEINLNMNWKDKKTWIIGASSGIGAALASKINNEGGYVILSARNEDGLYQIQSQLKYPENSRVSALDLSNSSSIHSAFQTMLECEQDLDCLIHCSGISQRSEVHQTSMSVDRAIFEVNYFGQIELTKLVLPIFRNKKAGKFIVISSFAGKWGFYLRSAYSASKHALHGFYESLQLENDDLNIQVHLITPGFVSTNISINALDGKGNRSLSLDDKQKNGISAEQCAEQILHGVSKEKREFGVGGSELFGLFLFQYFPRFFRFLLKRQSPR